MAAIFAAVQIALLVATSSFSEQRTTASVTASVLAVLDAASVCLLSYFEHYRSIRPSFLLELYLSCTLLFDAARTRTLWLEHQTLMSALFSSSLALKLMVLLIEAAEKRKDLISKDKKYGPEETSGMYSRSLFWWLNSLLRRGYGEVLGDKDLFPITQDMLAENVSARFQRAWDDCAYLPSHMDSNVDDEEARASERRLIMTLFHLLKWQLPGLVLARLALLGFTLCQPVLLGKLLSFLQSTEQEDHIGYGLLGAYGIVYIGIAVSGPEIRQYED